MNTTVHPHAEKLCARRSRARIAPATRKTNATFTMSKTCFLFENLTPDILAGTNYLKLDLLCIL